MASASSRCSRCRRVAYCGAKCQRAHWSAHRHSCSAGPIAAVVEPLDTVSIGATVSPPPRSASRGAASLASLQQLVALAGTDSARLAALPSAALRALLPASDAEAAEVFSRTAWPGRPGGPPAGAPRTLREALSLPALAAARAAAAERAAERSASVLAAVRARAVADGGPTLDSATETRLWPQAFAEAFVRELPAMLDRNFGSSDSKGSGGLVDATCADKSPGSSRAVASPYHVLAACTYSGSASRDLAPLLSPPPACGWSLHSGPFFISADTWRDLVADDCARMAEETARWAVDGGGIGSGARDIAGATASYTWLNDDECENDFPALSELLQRLTALPYELNRRVPGLLLLEPRPGAALLRRYTAPAAAAFVASGSSAVAGDGQAHNFSLPSGPTFALNAPAAPLGAGPPLGLVAVYVVGAAPVSSVPCSARLFLQAAKSAGDPHVDIGASSGNQLLLHRSNDVLLRPAITGDLVRQAFYTVSLFMPTAVGSSLLAPPKAGM